MLAWWQNCHRENKIYSMLWINTQVHHFYAKKGNKNERINPQDIDNSPAVAIHILAFSLNQPLQYFFFSLYVHPVRSFVDFETRLNFAWLHPQRDGSLIFLTLLYINNLRPSERTRHKDYYYWTYSSWSKEEEKKESANFFSPWEFSY